MTNNVPDTAGNTPEPRIKSCPDCDSIYSMMEPGGITKWGCSNEYHSRDRVAAPSQEAAPTDYFPCCDRYFIHTENCRAEPAPSPATKDTPPTNLASLPYFEFVTDGIRCRTCLVVTTDHSAEKFSTHKHLDGCPNLERERKEAAERTLRNAFIVEPAEGEGNLMAEAGVTSISQGPATKDMPQLESWMTREAFEWMNAALGLDAELYPYLADLIPAKAEISGLEREQWQKVVNIILRSADHADAMPQSLKDREPRKGPHSLKLRREV